MMSAAALFGIAVVGTLVWVANPETAVALFASSRRWNPLLVGLVAAGGQSVSLTLLFLFGRHLRRWWRWFDRQCERVRTRFGERMARNAVVVASASGLLGFPPVSVSATLAPGLAPRPLPLLPLMILLRIVRFTVVAALATSAARWWPHEGRSRANLMQTLGDESGTRWRRSPFAKLSPTRAAGDIGRALRCARLPDLNPGGTHAPPCPVLPPPLAGCEPRARRRDQPRFRPVCRRRW